MVVKDDELLVGDQWEITIVYFLSLLSPLHTRWITVKTFNGSVDVQRVRVTPMDALAFDDGVEVG